jgi:hypothetical protein
LVKNVPNFSVLNPWLPIHKMKENIFYSHSFIVPVQERTEFFCSVTLFNFMISLFVEELSFSKVKKVIYGLWCSQNVATDFASFKTIKNWVLSFGFLKIHPLVKSNQYQLINEHSQSLSGDHTYKFVKNLSLSFVKDGKKEKV